MMLKYKVSYFTILFTISLFSQIKNNKSKKSSMDSLCVTLKLINNWDQEKRILIETPFFDILDSIYKSEGISLDDKNSKLIPVKLLIQSGELTKEKMLENGKKANLILKTKKQQSKKEIDSLMKLQIILDNRNTELLIKIIKKRGYPNKENCTCDDIELKNLIVFRHSQPQYYDRIRLLIDKEHNEKRLNDSKYKLFINHINGRNRL